MLLENEVRVFTIIIKVVVTQTNNQQLIFVCLFVYLLLVVATRWTN